MDTYEQTEKEWLDFETKCLALGLEMRGVSPAVSSEAARALIAWLLAHGLLGVNIRADIEEFPF